MNVLLYISLLMNLFNSNNFIIDFGKDTGGQYWTIVNDDVMGGLSSSSAVFTESSLLFNGTLSLENNGGFASIRSANGKFDLSKYTTVKIKFRSTGRDFALQLSNSKLFFRPNYKLIFGSSTGEWEIVKLKIADFQQYTMGKISGPTINKDKLENIIRISIILSDKKEGPFEIEIDYIEFV